MRLQYQPTLSLRETAPREPTEMELQAIWFEQFFPSLLTTDDGEKIEILQAGDWNHGAGPDFFHAALRRANGEIKVGSIEVHLQAIDWQTHGHETDPAYENAILHVVWKKGVKAYYPATASFKCVPQVYLAEQLVAPWEVLQPHLGVATAAVKPIARSGRCHQRLSQLPETQILEILRDAGRHRLAKKAERLQLRTRCTGFKQMLWEALAEGLGYSQNKIPFRLIAQRLPLTFLKKMKREDRLATLFGIAGFLPHRSLTAYSASARKWIQPQWEAWWKLRDKLAYAILEKRHWKLTGVRPWNRPERRLAALALLVPKMEALERAIQQKEERKFSDILTELSDPFWDSHASLATETLVKNQRLIGAQRVHDLLINIFWPLIFLEDAVAAEKGLSKITAAENKNAEIARQRLIGHLPGELKIRNALVQQGLLQVYHDYCLHDESDCKNCQFRSLWERSTIKFQTNYKVKN